MNEHQRNVGNPEEYSKSGTIGYYCNTLGECVQLKPTEKEYYQDDNSKWSSYVDTKSNEKENDDEDKNTTYKVVQYDPINVNSDPKLSENHNGFEIVKDEGIFLLGNKRQSRRFAKCEYNDFDEMECDDI